MTTHHDDHSDENNLSSTEDRFGNNKEQRRETPTYSGFDEDDEEGFEEPDRDTDFSSGYGADTIEEESFDDFILDEDDSDLLPPPISSAQQDADNAWEEPEEAVESREWQEEQGYNDTEDENSIRDWPLGLICVAVIALLLVAIGGYGIIQQRSATQEEIRELRAALATAASPEDVSTSRAALQELKDANAELTANAEALTLYNRRLADTVAGLESQLKAQQGALTETTKSATEPATATPPATPPPAAPPPAAPKPVAPESVTSASSASAPTAGSWFVNFGSYAAPAMAETWATRLKPTTGRVIIAKSAKEGKTIYRVRVVDLTSKEAAKEVASSLEQEMGVSALWVGRE